MILTVSLQLVVFLIGNAIHTRHHKPSTVRRYGQPRATCPLSATAHVTFEKSTQTRLGLFIICVHGFKKTAMETRLKLAILQPSPITLLQMRQLVVITFFMVAILRARSIALMNYYLDTRYISD